MRRPRTLVAAGLAGLLLATGGTGCSSLAARRDARTQAALDEAADISDVAGPQERALRQVGYEENLAAVVDDPLLQKGQTLYDAGRYAEAAETYRAILKRFSTDFATKVVGGGGAIGRGTDRDAFNRYGSSVEERAQFMLGESLFMQGLFPKAADSYDTLIQRYPATRHLDAVTRRQFHIARVWLGFPVKELRTGGDIDLVGYEAAASLTKSKGAVEKPSFVQFGDASRPTLDAAGRARNLLTNIWLNDPTGPLADDALMLLGSYAYRTGDYVEAASNYEILREQYPESPHLENAYLLESHVRLASYDGPTYDAQNLERSAQLKQQTLTDFNLPVETRRRQQQELNVIEDERARREWANVEFYRRRGEPSAVKLHCHTILNEFSESRYVKPAQQMLQQLAEEQRAGGTKWYQRSLPPVPRSRKAPATKPREPVLREGLPPSLIPPSPQPEAAPQDQSQPLRSLPKPLRSEPFPSQDEFRPDNVVPPSQTPRETPNQSPPSGRSRERLFQAGYEADGGNPFAEAGSGIQRTAATDDDVETLPATNPFAEFVDP